MAKIKNTKTELKAQNDALKRYERFLPMLQLKKQQLQAEVENSRNMAAEVEAEIDKRKKFVAKWAALLSQKLTLNIYQLVAVDEIVTETENIAGVDVRVFKDVKFRPFEYSFFEKPIWLDKAFEELRAIAAEREKLKIVRERFDVLSEEMRQTSIKVNLFEKRKIPE